MFCGNPCRIAWRTLAGWGTLTVALLCLGSQLGNCLVRPLSVTIGFEHSDAIVVLGHASERGQLSPWARERLNHALTLWNTQRADVIVLSGGNPVHGVPESALMRDFMLAHGVPDSVIVEDSRATDTWENLVNVSELAKTHAWKSVHFVTSEFHTARVARTASVLGISYSIDHPANDSSRACQPDKGFVACWPIVREYGATVWFGLRHGPHAWLWRGITLLALLLTVRRRFIVAK